MCVCTQSTEKWLSDPLTSSFAESSIHLDAARVHVWQAIGALPSVLVSQAHDPAAVRSMQIGAEDFPEDSLMEATFTSVALSPRGVIADEDATINAAALVTDSRGGARIYTQSGVAQQWHVRVDMAAYLLRGYLAATWATLAKFDSTVQPVQPLPSVPNMVELNRRRQLVNVQCTAWSAKLQSRRGAPFVLVALGSKAGVVSVWKLALPILGAPEASAADSAAAAATAAAAAADSSAAAASAAASDPARHPELICTVTPSAGTHVFISQLSFSPLYFDSARQTTVCALAVGTSDGHAFVYGLQPEPSTDAAGAAASSIASVAAAAAADPISPALVPLHPLASSRVGSKLMAVSALCWNQILGGSAPTTVEDECAFCFGSRCEHRPPSGHGMSVHHVLAVGCGGQMQVHTFHPDLYASAGPAHDAEGEMADVAAAAAPAPAHPALCRSFNKRHAHATVINSFVWCVQSTSTLHPPRTLDAHDASVPLVGAECSPLSQHHLQLLSASNDDVVHRWILKDGVGTEGRGALLALDSNKLMDLAMFQPVDAALAAEAQGAEAPTALTVFPSPEPVHGSLGLLRSADGLLLLTYEVFMTGGAGLSVPNSSTDRKRFSIGVLKSAPFPFVDLTDDARESFAKLALEYSRIRVDDGCADTGAGAAQPPSRPESPTGALEEAKVGPASGRGGGGSAAPRSAIDIMHEELLEERRLEARSRAAATAAPALVAAQGAAAVASRGDHPVKMEIDTGDSPPAPAIGGSFAASAFAPSTPQGGVGRPRKSRGGAQAAKTPGSASASKAKKAKAKGKRGKRSKDGSDEEGESDESDEAWQEESDEDEDSASDDSDADADAHTDGEAKTSRRPTRSVGSKAKAKAKTRQPFKRRANDNLYANACNVPIPVAQQSELLEQQRIGVQLDLLLHKFVPLWRDVVQHAVRSRIARLPDAGPSTSTSSSSSTVPAASLSYFSLHTFIMSLLNPLHLTIPPALSAVPTRVVLDQDEGAHTRIHAHRCAQECSASIICARDLWEIHVRALLPFLMWNFFSFVFSSSFCACVVCRHDASRRVVVIVIIASQRTGSESAHVLLAVVEHAASRAAGGVGVRRIRTGVPRRERDTRRTDWTGARTAASLSHRRIRPAAASSAALHLRRRRDATHGRKYRRHTLPGRARVPAAVARPHARRTHALICGRPAAAATGTGAAAVLPLGTFALHRHWTCRPHPSADAAAAPPACSAPPVHPAPGGVSGRTAARVRRSPSCRGCASSGQLVATHCSAASGRLADAQPVGGPGGVGAPARPAAAAHPPRLLRRLPRGVAGRAGMVPSAGPAA